MSTRIALLMCLAACQSSAVGQAPQELDPFTGEQLPLRKGPLPYGLDCSQCMIARYSTCGSIPNAPLVADVRDLQPVNQRRRCATVDDSDQGERSACLAYEVVRFGTVTFLLRPATALPRDRFMAQHQEGGGTPVFSNGVQLRPQTRYVLFAVPANANAPFGARWFVTAACQIPASHELPPPADENEQD